MSKLVTVIAAALAAGAIAALAVLASRAEEPVRAVRPNDQDLDALYLRAAARAGGQRVLVIHDHPGAPVRGEVFESLEGPTGWALVAPVPPGSEDLAPVLDGLAAHTAEDWRPDRRLDEATVRALVYFGVSIVVAHDGRQALLPETREYDPSLKVRESIPGLAVSKAGPVFQLLSAPELETPGSALEFTRRVRRGDAQFGDYADRGWGGSMSIHSYGESDFAFAWPAAGASVTVDGQAVEPKSTVLPLLVVTLPEGDHEIVVTYGGGGMRSWYAIGAVAVLLVAIVLLLLAVRKPLVEKIEQDKKDAERAELGLDPPFEGTADVPPSTPDA